MGRTVEDTALLLDAMTGETPSDPLSLPRSESFLAAAHSGWRPARVAFSADLGITPVDPEVAPSAAAAAERFAEMGVIVEEAHPDLSEAHETFQVLRGMSFAVSYAGLLQKPPGQDEAGGDLEHRAGPEIPMADVVRAENRRAGIFHRVVEFFGPYDLLLCPAAFVLPFHGRALGEPMSWECVFELCRVARITYAITLTSSPALSLPCGFTRDGRPVGLQIVGRPRADGRVLAGARALEDILGLHSFTPIEPRAPRTTGHP